MFCQNICQFALYIGIGYDISCDQPIEDLYLRAVIALSNIK